MAFNDHTDWTWDERVLRMLTSLDQAFGHLCIQLTDCLQCFDVYADRCSSALAQVDASIAWTYLEPDPAINWDDQRLTSVRQALRSWTLPSQ
jgi:hypothetical protein